MCPDSTELLKVRGSFGASHFDYIKIAYLGCDLGEGCAPLEDLYDISVNFSDIKAYPNLLEDEDSGEHFKYQFDNGIYHFLDPDTEVSENVMFKHVSIEL